MHYWKPMPIDSRELQSYLHENIPLTKAMCMEVVHSGEEGIRLRAPLAPNINHRQTAFGGSISALAMTAGWSYVHRRLQSLEMPARIVVSNAETRFLQPAVDDFEAWCPAPPDKLWTRFIATFQKKGKARLKLRAWVQCERETTAIFEAEYVAVRNLSAIDGGL